MATFASQTANRQDHFHQKLIAALNEQLSALLGTATGETLALVKAMIVNRKPAEGAYFELAKGNGLDVDSSDADLTAQIVLQANVDVLKVRYGITT